MTRSRSQLHNEHYSQSLRPPSLWCQLTGEDCGKVNLTILRRDCRCAEEIRKERLRSASQILILWQFTYSSCSSSELVAFVLLEFYYRIASAKSILRRFALKVAVLCTTYRPLKFAGHFSTHLGNEIFLAIVKLRSSLGVYPASRKQQITESVCISVCLSACRHACQSVSRDQRFNLQILSPFSFLSRTRTDTR